MSNIAVIGLGFGDEGKGNIVNYLCSQHPDPIVIRHNGGHQAGHTVVHEGTQHTFSNVGSGALQEIETYWSWFCTMDPIGLLNELEVLNNKGVIPKVYIDPEAMVTTPYDIYHNHKEEEQSKHGTVGVGFGATIARNVKGHKLYFRDLSYPTILEEKMFLLQQYYGYELDIGVFLDAADIIRQDLSNIMCERPNINSFKTKIFEGAQGLLLDQHYGFFPHVTRSDTGSRNIRKITKFTPHQVYYVTRAYQTRHGNGPMTNDPIEVNNPNETNQDDGHQGYFRKTVLDLDLIAYALDCDRLSAPTAERHVVITCIDQLKQFRFTHKGELHTFPDQWEFAKEISLQLGLHTYVCESAECKELIKI